MSDSDRDGGGSAKASINIRVPEALLEDVDAAWTDDGYNSRSEFIRETLRDAVTHPELSRESWKEIAAVEHARRTDDSKTFSRDELLSDHE
jgi:metal-responsive CopG/Arc/MetJ family transcriptional regulator